jgi:hypothetical protein
VWPICSLKIHLPVSKQQRKALQREQGILCQQVILYEDFAYKPLSLQYFTSNGAIKPLFSVGGRGEGE